MKKFFVFLLLSFGLVFNVEAASICSYKEQNEINQKAANIKVNYEILQEERPSDCEHIENPVIHYRRFLCNYKK